VRVHHIALRTRDLAKLDRFYAELLRLRVTRRDGARSVWLDAGGTILMLERADEGEPAIGPGSNETLAFAVEPRARAEHVKRMGEAGVPLEGQTAFTSYFRDPDGRRVAVSHYPEPTDEAGRP
jgi:catechol 2,3-dioxygenase-like lactoylglutathione lyase family enzyme